MAETRWTEKQTGCVCGHTAVNHWHHKTRKGELQLATGADAGCGAQGCTCKLFRAASPSETPTNG
jgi:hypothetical protein